MFGVAESWLLIAGIGLASLGIAVAIPRTVNFLLFLKQLLTKKGE